MNLNDTPSRGPLTAAELARWQPAQHGRMYTSCAGPCNQGRNLCPCPDACQAAEADDNDGAFDLQCAVVWLAGFVIGVLVLIGGVSAIVGWWRT